LTEKAKLGFIGLGLMGGPIAAKLLENGYPMTVWGRSEARLAPFRDGGAAVAASPAELARESDVVFLCVTDAAAVEAVVFGDGGLAEGAGADQVMIDHSTIGAEATRDIAGRLEAATGAAWIDAPVSGGAPGVANKTLVVMAGGEAEAFARVAPVVESFAGRFTLMGPSGAGQTTKLINQALCGVGFALLAEVAKLAENAGVDVNAIPPALAGGRADSTLLQEYLPHMANRDFTPRGTPRIMLKDLEMVADLARATDTTMPVTALAREIFRLMLQTGRGDADNAAMVTLYES
jgi:3-hydroxyisobutyrate dehydrogenase